MNGFADGSRNWETRQEETDEEVAVEEIAQPWYRDECCVIQPDSLLILEPEMFVQPRKALIKYRIILLYPVERYFSGSLSNHRCHFLLEET